MQKVELKVEGMTCSNCALSVTKLLQKKSFTDIKVSPIIGAVSFRSDKEVSMPEIEKGIASLGYTVAKESNDDHQGHSHSEGGFLKTTQSRFLFTLPFTLVLLLHMLHDILPLHWLMNPWVQLALCLPVFFVGMYYFGKSAVKSIATGVPNMDVLITIGALAAFVYSLYGAIMQLGEDYLFFETTATIITLVFFGNYLEHRSVATTQTALQSLVKKEKVMANMIAFDDKHEEQIFPVENTILQNGDLVLIKTGEQVPADCKILTGDAMLNEAIITGESAPVAKTKKDFIIGGSVVESGIIRAQVTASGKGTVLASIIQMVENAQGEKPPMQKLADKISAIFVPIVLGIAVLTFIINHAAFDKTVAVSLMRSIAVLVISCPCAMGLATPAAIAVGMGRAAKSGILFRNAAGLESFKSIQQVVFDKTGTLTTGKFKVLNFHSTIDETTFKQLIFSIEKFSSHPIASAITEEWKTSNQIRFDTIEEIKGAGMQANDKEGNSYKLGTALFTNVANQENHSFYLTKNEQLLGWVNVGDEIREEAKEVIAWLQKKKINTILLTGDKQFKANQLAQELGIDTVYAEKTPSQKLDIITSLNDAIPTAMVGDGVNDAPALAKATLGISLSAASQLAVQTADVVLVNDGLKNLPKAMGLGRHTDLTIKQNLFWAFAYNVVAIPVAAMGYLTPAVAALAMAFSDVILVLNSVRLFVKKVY